MDSSREDEQPARTLSSVWVSADVDNKPQLTRDEGLFLERALRDMKGEQGTSSSSSSSSAHHDLQQQKDEPYSLVHPALPRARTHPSPRDWLVLASDNAPRLTHQTQQLIKSMASLQMAMDSVSHLVSRRQHDRLSSSSSSSLSSSSSSSASGSWAGWPNLQDMVEMQECGLRNLCRQLSQEVDKEIQEAALEQSRRDLAKQKLKEDEEKGIQLMRQSLGLPVNNTTDEARPQDLVRSQSAVAVAEERAKSLTKGEWRKTW
ncbi:hypothetical protein PG993_003731 [Apiospora rasikravindrae]|uniref:Uncharacterized protein n=1 Tax=Apiospora rasikravindrae TaxID=990691 RepID=A0ABR1U0C7_9PEZI